MRAFILICNPVEVWDFRAFFALKPTKGYWCVTKTNFATGQAGDRLYLRTTSKDVEPGIHGRFLLASRYKGNTPKEHWISGNEPKSPSEQFRFNIGQPALLDPFISVSLLKSTFNEHSRLIKTPQTLSAEITCDEADELDRILKI